MRSPSLRRLPAIALVFGLSPACRPPADNCAATLEYRGKTYVAQGRDRPLAEGAACARYCHEDDAELAAAYDAWRKTPEGARSTKSRDEAMRTEAPVHLVQQRCSLACVSAVMGGKAKSVVSCKRGR